MHVGPELDRSGLGARGDPSAAMRRGAVCRWRGASRRSWMSRSAAYMEVEAPPAAVAGGCFSSSASRALCTSCLVFLTVHRTEEPHVMAVEQKWETQIHRHVNHYHQCLQTSHLIQQEMMDHRPKQL